MPRHFFFFVFTGHSNLKSFKLKNSCSLLLNYNARRHATDHNWHLRPPEERNHCTGHFTPLLRTLSYQLLPPVTETYRTTIVACPPKYLHIFPNRSHVYLTLFKNFLHVKRIKVSPCSAKGNIWLLFIVGQSYIILNQFPSSSIF